MTRSIDVEPLSGTIESNDIDEYAQLIQPWEVRLNQLSAGQFHGNLQFVRTPDMLFYEERWNRRAEVRGATPQGYVMFGTNADWERSSVEWCGEKTDIRNFACSSPSGEIDIKTPDDSHHAVVLVRPELLTQALGLKRVAQLSGRKHVGLAAGDGDRLAASIVRTVRRYSKSPGLLDSPFEVKSAESRLLEILGNCIGQGIGDSKSGTGVRRAASVRRAIEFAESRRGLVTALELAVVAGVSQRGLEYTFREMVGTTPGAYLRLLRMNLAHRDLAIADPEMTTVTRIAHASGFHHLGRFSVAHRRLFGEPPYQTLRRSRIRPNARFLNSV